MSKRLSEEKIEEIVSNLDIKVGMGDPSSPLFGQLLSVEDEQKLDPKGELVVNKAPWSKVSTGLYLTVAVTLLGTLKVSKTLGGRPIPVPWQLSKTPLWLYVLTSEGKTTFDGVVAGAALELPSDLGQASLNRKYVVEWIRDTATEGLAMYGADLANQPEAYKTLGLSVAIAAEEAIMRTGL